MPFITRDDLAPFADINDDKADAMIADAVAMAAQVAPCISTDDFQANVDKMSALKAILRGAVLRWNDAGSGAISQRTAGPFQQTLDTTHERRSMYWPSEISQLEALCKTDSTGGAFAFDTAPDRGAAHVPWCATFFGATYCSCAAELTRGEYPLYEGGVITQGLEQ